MLLPKVVPAGTSYVRIPMSKRATMRLLLEAVQRGYCFWTAGCVAPEKGLRFAEKMRALYDTDHTAAQRAYAKKQGQANAQLIMFKEEREADIRYWLLATAGKGLVHAREQLCDAREHRQHLTWGDQYVLRHVQRPREHSGGRAWTWQLTAQRYALLEASMAEQAAARGNTHGNTEALAALVTAILRMPGFYGIRQQQRALLDHGAAIWARTHRARDAFAWPTTLPYLTKAFPCYHAPEPLRLDVLVRILEQASGRPPADGTE